EGPSKRLEARERLSSVFRGDADPLADLREDPPCVVRDDDADPRGARIAPRRPVRVGDQLTTRILRQYSHLRMPVSRFKWSRKTGESFWRHPMQTPSTSATAPTPFF